MLQYDDVASKSENFQGENMPKRKKRKLSKPAAQKKGRGRGKKKNERGRGRKKNGRGRGRKKRGRGVENSNENILA